MAKASSVTIAWKSCPAPSVRLLASGDRGPGDFPPPAARAEQRNRPWRWAEVAQWFTSRLGETVTLMLPPDPHEPFASAEDRSHASQRLLERHQLLE